jgi:hypothetical protein
LKMLEGRHISFTQVKGQRSVLDHSSILTDIF